jgi:hypothetical protein
LAVPEGARGPEGSPIGWEADYLRNEVVIGKCRTNPPWLEVVYLTGFGGVSILPDPELLEADHGLEEWELFAGSNYPTGDGATRACLKS